MRYGVPYVIALESSKVIGYLRYHWVRNSDRELKKYNYRKPIFRNKRPARNVFSLALTPAADEASSPATLLELARIVKEKRYAKMFC